MSIIWVGAIHTLKTAKQFMKKGKMLQTSLYEYNLGSYSIHSLRFDFRLICIEINVTLSR